MYTPVTTEAFATYGVIDNGAIAQPLQTPTGVVPQYGGLEVDTSSTAMQTLTDAVVYMNDYPYESADAYASRIIALTSLRDVFAAFGGAGVPTPAQVDARINADIKSLQALQNGDGGFSTWTRDGDPQPYISVEAAEALVLARLAGFAVSDSARDRALAYIRDIESKFPSYWDTPERHATSAYALHVRFEAGDRDAAKADALYRSDPALPLDTATRGCGRWWTIPPSAARSRRRSRIGPTKSRARRRSPRRTATSANLVLGSDRRTDGIVLDALITMQPGSDLIPKVVAGLIGNQVQGRWDNIQENGFILVALHRYFEKYETQTPSFVARAWLGDTFAAQHSFQGRSIDTQHTLVPMTDLDHNPNIVLQKDGTGRLYYRLGLQYAPSNFKLGALDEGFVVDRRYQAVNDPGDVRQDKDGVWHIKPGAMVRVKLTMEADTNHTNMALVDNLPAGLEAVNPALAASPRPPAQKPAAGARRPVSPCGTDRHGSTTRTCATIASRRSAPISTAGRTTTRTWHAPRRSATSSCLRPKPRRSTRPRCSDGRPATGSTSGDGYPIMRSAKARNRSIFSCSGCVSGSTVYGHRKPTITSVTPAILQPVHAVGRERIHRDHVDLEFAGPTEVGAHLVQLGEHRA